MGVASSEGSTTTYERANLGKMGNDNMPHMSAGNPIGQQGWRHRTRWRIVDGDAMLTHHHIPFTPPQTHFFTGLPLNSEQNLKNCHSKLSLLCRRLLIHVDFKYIARLFLIYYMLYILH